MATLPKTLSQSQHSSPTRKTSIAEVKANLSSIVKSVEHDRTEVTILRRGIAVAKIVPVLETDPVSGYGWMRGTVTELGDIVGPTGEEWDVTGE